MIEKFLVNVLGQDLAILLGIVLIIFLLGVGLIAFFRALDKWGI